jgi:cytochrome c-type biogenesis protein CcmH/NrfF
MGLAAADHDAPVGPRERARAVERELRCPVCEGQSVADSRTQTAAAMRAQVISLTTGGAGAGQIREWFVQRYGRGILLLPPASGPDLVLWLTPAAPIVLATGYLTFSRLTDRRSRAEQPVRRGPAAEKRT